MAVKVCPTCRGFGSTVVEPDSDEPVRLTMFHGAEYLVSAMERRVTCGKCRGQGRVTVPGTTNIHVWPPVRPGQPRRSV